MGRFGARRSIALGSTLAAASVALLVLCTSAGAVVVHPYLGSFGPDGSAGTAFGRPGAVAVDQSDGDVYVADTAAGAIYKFGPEGEPVDFAALGSNELEGLSFSDAEPGLVELAVNSSTHDLYVVENAPVNGVSVFHANGEAAEFSPGVGHTLSGFSELCGVGVDSEGDVYAADYEGGVEIFDPSGTPLTSLPISSVCGIAVGPGGALYANEYRAAVYRFDPSEYPVTAATTYAAGPTIDPGPVVGVAADPINGDVYTDERDKIAQHNTGGILLGLSGAEGEGALDESEGVAVTGSTGRLFASAPGGGSGGQELVARYDAGETEQPRIEAERVSAVGDAEATLSARINPLEQPTTYRFEYGDAPCGSGGCASTPTASIGAGEATIEVSRQITGLQPGHTYYFRVVVIAPAGAQNGVDRVFRTYAATTSSSIDLPDDRGYELVTPGPDNSADLGVPGPTAGLVVGGALPQRAAADGAAFGFPSFTSFGAATAAPNASYYLAKRGENGWSTTNITPRDEGLVPVGPVRAFSADLGTTAIVANSVLAPGAVPDYPNLYLRDNATGSLIALTTSQPEFATPRQFCVNYIGASADGRRVIFAADGGLTPEAPAPVGEPQPYLYEWSAEDGIRLVSVLPDGTAAPDDTGLGFGPGNEPCLIDLAEVTRHPISADGNRIFWSQTAPSRKLFARVAGTRTIELDAAQGGSGESGGGTFVTASATGSRVFFTDPRELVAGASLGEGLTGSGDLYEYDLEDETLTDLTPPVGPEPTEVLGLVGASEDGSYVYFVAEGALRTGALSGAPNLYLDHEGALSFIARLAPGDGLDWGNQKKQTAIVSPDGRHLAFVSVEPLTGYDNDLASGEACRRRSNGDPEGGSACDEVFLYDIEGDRLSCASCNPSGSAPIGPVAGSTESKRSQLNTVPTWTTPFEQPRYLSKDGSRLFFLSEEGLVPGDTNGKQDVYEFERPGGANEDCSAASPTYVPTSEGCLSLISTGRSTDDSYLLDASESGSDVFFSTNQALVAEDEDRGYDIYDARIGGSSPPGAGAETPCLAEGCRGMVPPPPSSGTVGTGTSGGGNLATHRCPKGKTRDSGRCVAKHHEAKHKKKRHNHGKKRGGK
jgi:hypothetical protein